MTEKGGAAPRRNSLVCLAATGEHTVRILDAVVEPDIQIEVRQPGKIVFMREGSPIVVCGRGLLRVY